METAGKLTDPAQLETISRVIPLNEAIPAAHSLLNGEIRGRVVVDVNN